MSDSAELTYIYQTLPKRVALLEQQREYWAKPMNDLLEEQRDQFGLIFKKLDEHDKRFEAIDIRLYKLEERVGSLEGRMDHLENMG